MQTQLAVLLCILWFRYKIKKRHYFRIGTRSIYFDTPSGFVAINFSPFPTGILLNWDASCLCTVLWLMIGEQWLISWLQRGPALDSFTHSSAPATILFTTEISRRRCSNIQQSSQHVKSDPSSHQAFMFIQLAQSSEGRKFESLKTNPTYITSWLTGLTNYCYWREQRRRGKHGRYIYGRPFSTEVIFYNDVHRPTSYA